MIQERKPVTYFTHYYSDKAITFYVLALFASNLVFFSHVLSPMWWIFGLVEVIGFFYFSNTLSKQWQRLSLNRFPKKLFATALMIRLVWVIVSYFFYTWQTGKPFEFDAADALGYHDDGLWIASLISKGSLKGYIDSLNGRYSDLGYALYLGTQYFFTGGIIIIERLLKAVYGAYTCVLIYRLAQRTFGETVARNAAIFCMLMPNLILYTGIHVKEVEMLLLTVWYIERSDFLLRSKALNFQVVFPVIALAGSLFFFRTVLGATAVFALFTALMFSSEHVMNMGKRLILIIWLTGTAAFFVGGAIANEVEAVWAARQNNQEKSMDMRATQKNGNKYAKKMGAAVFAPMMFVIPFPTVVETPKQQNQKIINGGNYVKNVLAFFVIFGMFTLIKENRWRDYLLIGSFVVGYLIVLAFSAFAQSERFHQPVLPFEMIFAAYGFSLMTKRNRKIFDRWMLALVLMIIGWSWFKLAGRGMV